MIYKLFQEYKYDLELDISRFWIIAPGSICLFFPLPTTFLFFTIKSYLNDQQDLLL